MKKKNCFNAVILTAMCLLLPTSAYSFSDNSNDGMIASKDFITSDEFNLDRVSIRSNDNSSAEESKDLSGNGEVSQNDVVSETSELKSKSSKKAEARPKLNLSAILFDPHTDLKATAEMENREMTPMEVWGDDLHEKLYGEVVETSKLSSKGLLSDYLTYKSPTGFAKVKFWNFYRGGMSFNWADGDYEHTFYNNNSMFSVIDAQFGEKVKMRTMWLWNKSKDGHDFFNDCFGDQTIQYLWSKNDTLQVGYSRNPVGIEGRMGTIVTPFYSRSQIASRYGNARALGVRAMGKHKYYEYDTSFTSSGRYFEDWFAGPEYTVNVAAKPLGYFDGKYGKLLVGTSLNGGNSDSSYLVSSSYIDYEYKRWNLTLEYGYGNGSNGSTGYTKNKSQGFNGTIGYRLTPKTQILFRYDVFDPNRNKSNDIRTEYTVGINHFLIGQSLRLILDWTYYTVQNGTYGARLYAGTQIIL